MCSNSYPSTLSPGWPSCPDYCLKGLHIPIIMPASSLLEACLPQLLTEFVLGWQSHVLRATTGVNSSWKHTHRGGQKPQLSFRGLVIMEEILKSLLIVKHGVIPPLTTSLNSVPANNWKDNMCFCSWDRSSFSSCGLCWCTYVRIGQTRVWAPFTDPYEGPHSQLLQSWKLISDYLGQ